ncbi:hypothetical protein Tco_0281856, partial [Tanacetum coccineum]
MIPNPDNTQVQILEPLSKMTKGNKKQYVVDVKVMNYLLQAIPNDIYNSVDASKKAKEIWQRIKRLMFGSDVTSHVRHSRLMDVFDKFAAKEGESLESVYERLTTLVNIMDRNNVHPIPVSISTRDTVSYDVLYYSLVQFKPHVLASKAKKAAKNHDPLALIAHSNASSSQSYANSSYSPQSYYVTHRLSIIDYEDEYQGELQGDSQEDKITTAMMLLAREITQKFSTPTNNGLHTSSKTRNQVVIQDGRVDIQTKNASYGGNNNMNAGRQNRNQAFNAGTRNDERNQIVQRVPRTESTPRKANVQCYNYNEKGHYACDCQKPKVCDAKYFREKMLLAMKDEAGSILKDEENDFLLDNSYEDDTMEELTAAVMLMAQIQPADGNTLTVPSYDAKVVSEVNASSKVHEQMSHVKRKTIIQTSDDDQIDSNIIFDDPYVEHNGVTSDDDSNAHDKYHEIQMLAYNVQKEAENKKRLNNELKKQKMLLQKELETCKDQVKTFESKTIQFSKYKETYEELKRELRADKDTIERILKEKEKIQNDFLKFENEKLIIQHETQLAKKAFKDREDRYLDDIDNLEEKLSYNPERLKKAIAAQPKVYDGEILHSATLKIDSPDYEETLEDAEESRLKMRNKMVQINYAKLNSLYETFVPQQEYSIEQTYFSIPSTSNIGSESKEVTSNLPIPKMPNESKLLKMFDKMGVAINGLRTWIDKNLLEDKKRRWMSDNQNSLREFYKTDVISMCASLSKNLRELKEELIDEIGQKPATSHPTPKDEQIRKQNENVLARGMYIITKTKTQTPESKTNINVSNSTSVESSNSVRRPKSKDNKLKNRVLKNTNDKISSAYVWKMSSSVSIDSNKCETMNSTICHANKSVSNTKNVTAINDSSNIIYVSCGKDVFLLSHEKCVARYALFRNSSVKRALFTTPIATKSKNLGATSIVAKSRLSVAKTPTATNKVSSVLPLSPDSSQSRTLSNYMNNKIATSTKWHKWFENHQGYNWTPKTKTAKSHTSMKTSSISVIQLVLWIIDRGCSKHMTGNLQLLRNFVEKFMGTVRFRNDHFTAITGYGDYVQGNLTICHVYYVEGLGHNLLSVGQFCDGDLEVAFRSNTCYVQNLEGDDLLTGSRDSNLYTRSISEMAASSIVC